MIMSNYMILSSLTAALIILIRINWGSGTGCTCKPSLWPLPGLLSLNWESLCGKSEASSAWTLHFLKSAASWKQVNKAQNTKGVAVRDAGDGVLCCGRDGHNTVSSGSCSQVKRTFLQSKNMQTWSFFFFFWQFARHIGFVAAGILLILVLV